MLITKLGGAKDIMTSSNQLIELMTMNDILKWELDWIDKNADRYESAEHASLVKHNIMKRYLTKEIRERFKQISVAAMVESHVDMSNDQYTGGAMKAFLEEIVA